jgi:hypothetical protein
MGDVTGDSPPGSSYPRGDVFVLSGYLAPTSSFFGLSLLERGCRTDSIHLRVAAQEGAEMIESSRVRVRFDVDDKRCRCRRRQPPVQALRILEPEQWDGFLQTLSGED